MLFFPPGRGGEANSGKDGEEEAKEEEATEPANKKKTKVTSP